MSLALSYSYYILELVYLAAIVTPRLGFTNKPTMFCHALDTKCSSSLLAGRAAMVGFVVGYLVDSATGAGLVDQQSTFLGKTLLVLTVLGVLLIRKTSDVGNLKTMAKESTFYDKQWQATWKDEEADIAKEKDSDIP